VRQQHLYRAIGCPLGRVLSRRSSGLAFVGRLGGRLRAASTAVTLQVNLSRPPPPQACLPPPIAPALPAAGPPARLMLTPPPLCVCRGPPKVRKRESRRKERQQQKELDSHETALVTAQLGVDPEQLPPHLRAYALQVRRYRLAALHLQ